MYETIKSDHTGVKCFGLDWTNKQLMWSLIEQSKKDFSITHRYCVLLNQFVYDQKLLKILKMSGPPNKMFLKTENDWCKIKYTHKNSFSWTMNRRFYALWKLSIWKKMLRRSFISDSEIQNNDATVYNNQHTSFCYMRIIE